MPEEETPEVRRKPKKALPEEPKEEPVREEPERPTPQRVRRAHKADLVNWCEQLGLNSTGTVVDLRKRLLAKLAEAEPPAKVEPEAKPAAERPEKASRAARKVPKEEVEEEEEPAFEAKAKPEVPEELRRLLRLRERKDKSRPAFRRQEWFRYARLGTAWRRPQGHHSKLRRGFRYRINRVSVGYRGPAAVRGLHPSGFREVLVHNVRDLERIDAKTQAARIAHGVGSRKRSEIETAAAERGIRVLNRMGGHA